MSRNVSDTSPAASASAARSRSRPKVAETGSVLLRGGRLTRVAGVVASYAPALGRARPALLTSASALALSAAAFLGFGATGALAQNADCARDDGASQITVTCSGLITTQQSIEAEASEKSVSVTVSPSASVTIPLNVTGRDGEAFYVSAARAISFAQSSATQVITGNTRAVYLLKRSGPGPVSISAAGTLIGRDGDGLLIIQDAASSAGDSTTVNVATVTGGESGINVAKFGGGSITVTASGLVTSLGTFPSEIQLQPGMKLPGLLERTDYKMDAAGIRVWAMGSGTSQAGGITITAGSVESSKGHGIYAKNLKSSGAVSIVATGIVTSSGTGAGVTATPNWAGIYAFSSSTGGVSVRAASVTASAVGIRAVTTSSTTGNISINSTGTISAGTIGVEAKSSGTGNITVNVGTVTAVSGNGIDADGGPDGSVSVSAVSVMATSADANAIKATSSGAGGITITAGQVEAASNGIHAESSGSGNIAITATGRVNASGSGIYAKTAGSVSVNLSGSIVSKGTGNKAAAIYASASDDITITAAGNVEGEKYGIYAHHSGSGTASIAINVSGMVTGGSGSGTAAIRTNAANGSSATVSIVLESGANVGGTGQSVTAINAGDRKSTVTAKAGSTISGAVNLGAGDNEFRVTGATVTGSVNFGDDNDKLTLNGTSATISGNVTFGAGDDTLTFDGDTVMVRGSLIGGEGQDELKVTKGTVALGSGTEAILSDWETITIGGSAGDPTATVTVGNNSGGDEGFNSDNTNSSTVVLNETGVISLANRSHDNHLQLHSLAGNNGTIILDASFAATSQSDQITIRGSVSGTTYLQFEPIGNLPIDPKQNNAEVKFAYVETGATNDSFKARGDYRIRFEDATSQFFVKYSPAACNEETEGSGVFDCKRDISTTQALSTSGTTNLVVNLSNAGEVPSGASIVTKAGNALTLRGGGQRSITFTQSGTGAITGAEHAISVTNSGTGDVSIATTGVVTGGTDGTGSAISVYNTSDDQTLLGGSNVTISAEGALTSSTHNAVDVLNGKGGENVSITVATVTTTAPDEETQHPTNSSTYLISKSAIAAANAGTGALTVVATGTVTSQFGTAIVASNPGYVPTSGAANEIRGTDVTVTVVDVSGGKSGIVAYNNGTGSVTVTATGAITAKKGLGVDATNKGSGRLSVSVTTVSANDGLSAAEADETYGGIRAVNEIGNGSVEVSATGNVSTDHGHGIYAAALGEELNANGAVTITAAGVSAGGSGIRAVARGAITVSATGIVSSDGTQGKSVGRSQQQDDRDRFGPLMLNDTAVNDDPQGNFDAGIYASSTNEGAISVTARIVRASGFGIYATGNANINVSVASVTAGGDGVAVRNSSGGSISINASGHVSAGESPSHGRFSTGIFALNASTASAGVTVTAADVTGDALGIFAKNEGSGAVAVTAGTVSARGDTISGLTLSGTGVPSVPVAAVYAMNDESGAGVSISVNSVAGANHGIYAINDGSGDLKITASSNVVAKVTNPSATGVTGITALDTGAGGSLAIRAGAVSSDGGDAIYARHFGAASNASATIAVATVTGDESGIYLHSSGGGLVSVTVAGDVSAMGSATNSDGFKVADPNAFGVKVIKGSTNGNEGGDIFIDLNAVTAAHGDGIFVKSTGTGAIRVTAGNVKATSSAHPAKGVYVHNSNSGGKSVAINLSGVEASGDAIHAMNEGTGATVALTVSATTVSGGGSGIDLHSKGGGLVSLTVAGSVSATGTADSDAGVRVTNMGGGISIDLQGAVTTSGKYGISAVSSGAGAIAVTAKGKVTATASSTSGVHVKNDRATGTSVMIDVSSVEAGINGIYAKNMGSGALTISATGTVAAMSSTTSGSGIHAENSTGGDLMITASGAVMAIGSQTSGIMAENKGQTTGSLTIMARQGVTGGIYGVHATNSGSGTLAITAVGTVRATSSMTVAGGNKTVAGIFAKNSTGGDLMITASDAVTAAGSMTYGIRAINESGTASLTIMAQGVTGGKFGVHAASSGSGTTEITAAGQVTGNQGGGIMAKSSGAGGIVVNAATVTAGAGHGIYIDNSGGGLVSVTTTGAVRGNRGDTVRLDDKLAGIYVDNDNDEDGSSVTISAANEVFGDNHGIKVLHKGTADVGISIAAHDISAKEIGVYAENKGTGAVSVIVAGVVNITGSGTFEGIRAVNSDSSGSNVTVEAAHIRTAGSAGYGIKAVNHGSGTVSIKTTGSVSATGSSAEGVAIYAMGKGTSMTIVTGVGQVSGGKYGIQAKNEGTSNTSNLVINAASVSASSGTAIHAKNTDDGGGSVSIDAGTVMASGSGTAISGVYAYNKSSSGGITITAANVTLAAASSVAAGGHGIRAENEGSGAIMINLTGTASKSGSATTTAAIIHAENSDQGASITVNAASVSGEGSGIRVVSKSSGTYVTATTVNVSGVSGIDVMSSSAGDIEVTATNVSAKDYGIKTVNESGGSISIDVEGSVSVASTTDAVAVHATNSSAGSSVTVNVASVRGKGSGVKIDNNGTEGVVVNATSVAVEGMHGIHVTNSNESVSITAGTVSASGTGDGGAGIYVKNENGTALTITATSVSGGGHGVYADHDGSGSLSISVASASSAGTGTDHAAIRANNSSKGEALTITAGNVDAVGHGVHATNNGSGALSIRVSSARSTGTTTDKNAIHAYQDSPGALTVSAGTAASAGGKGIYAKVISSSHPIKITATHVEGATHGVYAKHDADGSDVEVTIERSLSVSGSNGIGIESLTTGGGKTKVVIARNATVTASGANAHAVKTDEGDATVTVNAGANVTGKIQTHDGEDRVTLLGNGIRFAGDIDLEVGGEEEDQVTLSGNGITLVGDIVLGKGPDRVTVNGDNVRIEGDIELGLRGDTHANVLTLSGDGISIDGSIKLGDGTDQITFSGNNISVGDTINFGRGNDSLSFGVGATTIANLDGGSGGETGTGDVLTFQRGSNVTLNGRNPLLNWESVVAREGARVRFDGKQTLESKEMRFEQGSVLSMKDGATDDELTMQVVSFTGHGSLEIDVDFAGGVSDKIMVARNTIYDPERRTGNVIDGRVSENTPHSPTQIVINPIPASGDVETGTKIRVAEVEGDLRLEGESGTGRGFVFAKGDGNSIPGDSTKLYVGAFELTLELDRDSNGSDHTFDVNVVDKRVNDAGAILEMAPSVIISRFATPPSLSKRTFGRQIAAFDGTSFGLVSQNFSEGNNIIGAGAGESWIRAYGEVVDFGRSTSGADTESVGYGVQAGADVASYELGGGDLVMGLAAQYGQVKADVTSNNHRNGEISTSGYGVGAIASWFGSAGLYVDVQTQINWLESDLTSSSMGVLATGNETSAVFTSVEIGRRFAFGSNGAVVPQGQISRGQVDTDPFQNGPNFEVKFGNETAVIARLGVAAEFTDANGKGYLLANLLHDFSETRSVEISGTKLRDQSDSTMLEVGLGGSVAVSDRSIIFVEGSYKSAIGGDGNDERSTGLSGGFQWKW